ncbi:MAG: HAD family hydrolase [Spirochaetales bacterium]|nr:HAD family hydrolase [Spirochaetales bacterium]
MKKVAFLDRDGTLIRNAHYLSRPEQIEILSGVREGLQLLKQYHFMLIILTNQSGIGRGYFSETDLKIIHTELLGLFAQSSILFDAIYYCPHHPDEECECRKPRKGMLLTALQEQSIDLSVDFAVLIGDSDADMGLARNARIAAIAVPPEKPLLVTPDYQAQDFLDAATEAVRLSGRSD